MTQIEGRPCCGGGGPFGGNAGRSAKQADRKNDNESESFRTGCRCTSHSHSTCSFQASTVTKALSSRYGGDTNSRWVYRSPVVLRQKGL